MTTGLIYSDRFLEHDTGPGHPERPDRLRAIVAALKARGLWDGLSHLSFEPADRAIIERLHRPQYVERVIETCRNLKGIGCIDTPDSVIGPASAEIAQLAVGGAVAAVDAVMGGRVNSAFCAVRPPGHHAEADRSMGFCLFNNIALAAEHLVAHHRLERIAIIDFDVHHGNGTQHLFEKRSDVLFVSVHEDPRVQYPGTGFAHETGIGPGEGFTLNIPLPPECGDEAYEVAMKEQIVPRVREHDPQFVLISAGFDAAAGDPLGHMRVTPDGFARLTEVLAGLAGDCCNGRVVSVLEGGYDLNALAESVARHVGALCPESR